MENKEIDKLPLIEQLRWYQKIYDDTFNKLGHLLSKL